MRRKTVQNHKCQRQRGARDCRVTRSSRTELLRTKARLGPHRATEADSSGTGSTGQQKLPTFFLFSLVIPAQAGIPLLCLGGCKRQGDSSLRWNDGGRTTGENPG